MISLALMLMLQAGEPELQYGGQTYWQGQGWTVYSYPDEGQCDLAAEFSSGELLTVGLNTRDQSAGLIVTNKHATSLTNGQTVNLEIILMTKKVIIRRLRAEFTAKTTEQRIFVSETLPTDFVKDFGRADMFGVFYGKNLVAGASSLPGSAIAAAQLKACADKTGGVDPLDPFRK